MEPFDPLRDPLHALLFPPLYPGAAWDGSPERDRDEEAPEDPVFEAFLETQLEEGMRLASESDLVQVIPGFTPRGAPRRYLLRFAARCLVRDPATGRISEAEGFSAAINFPPHHLHRADPPRTLAWISPPHAFHPNIAWPSICAGRLLAGTPLVDLAWQIGDIATYRKMTTREDDALNREACAWARRQPPDRFPVDRRPLKRKPVVLEIEEVSVEARS